VVEQTRKYSFLIFLGFSQGVLEKDVSGIGRGYLYISERDGVGELVWWRKETRDQGPKNPGLDWRAHHPDMDKTGNI